MQIFFSSVADCMEVFCCEKCCFILFFLSPGPWTHSVQWTCCIIDQLILLLNSLFALFKCRPYCSSLDPPLCNLIHTLPAKPFIFPQSSYKFNLTPHPLQTEDCNTILFSAADEQTEVFSESITVWSSAGTSSFCSLEGDLNFSTHREILSQGSCSLVSLFLVLVAFSDLHCGSRAQADTFPDSEQSRVFL